jgi:hypothetical protein
MKPLPLFAAAEETLGAVVALGIVAWLAIQAYRRWMPERPTATETPAVDDTTDVAIEEGELEQPLCLRCLTPYGPTTYFCPHCNAAVGPYNNWMPYLHIYSEGQWLRDGSVAPARSPWLIHLGYGLLSLAVLGPFAPILWIVWSVMRRPAIPAPPRA